MTAQAEKLDWKLASIEEVMRDMDYDIPIAWATLFVYENADRIANGCPELADEVQQICKWIDEGDPERELEEEE